MKQLDVHGLTLSQAKIVISKEIANAYKNDISVLYINHGFNNGTKIKTWCKNQAINLAHVIKVESGTNEGISKIFIETNFLK